MGFGGFGLGRFSAIEREIPEMRIEESAEVISTTVVASKNGTKYHFPWCGGAVRIKPENILEFSDFSKARDAGYTPAQNCKGLK